MLENFHFIRPLWLLAMIPLSLVLWYLYRSDSGDNPWRRIVDARLLPLLMIGRAQTAYRLALWLLACGWIIAVLALSGPTWERKPQLVYQSTAARVVVLDLSRSMNTTDLRPSRLVRARFKVEDVLALDTEGQTGLVVYSGDAFTVSPLTRDANTVRALLKVLQPEIMPVDGSRADLGLSKAGELLHQAGATEGQVLLIADGVDAGNIAASEAAAEHLRKGGYTVSVLGVGAADSAPLDLIARAGGGEYRDISDDGEALRALLRDRQAVRAQASTTDTTVHDWKEQGPLVVILLLPLAALAFRRNWLLSVLLLAGLASPPQPLMAAGWNDLWARPDQQAAKALQAGDFGKAAELANDAYLRGVAEYKRGNYQRALENFSKATGADANYNRGNALARLGRYQDAIAAYDKALGENPGDEDALANKAAVEALLKQQPTPQQPSNSQSEKSQKRQSQNGGDGQKSSQIHSRDPSSEQRDDAQSGSSHDRGQARMNAAQTQDSSPEHAADTPPANADSSEHGDQHAPASPQTAQQTKPDNQFADAAKQLTDAEQHALANSGDDQQLQEANAGSASQPTQSGAKDHAQVAPADSARPLDSEEQMAAEQWLRRIPDDPGGLLRRKFLYQYQQRAQQR